MTAKRKPKYRYLLRVLAGKLETGSLTQSERAGLAKLLRGLSEGFSVQEMLDEPTEPHRPTSKALEQRIFDVAVLMRPKKHGGEGLTKAIAIEQVAELSHVTVNTIEDDYKSARGKKIRELVKTKYYNPLA